MLWILDIRTIRHCVYPMYIAAQQLFEWSQSYRVWIMQQWIKSCMIYMYMYFVSQPYYGVWCDSQSCMVYIHVHDKYLDA